MTYTLERTNGFSSRGLVFGFILLGHLGFFWMLNSGLASGTKIVDRILQVVDVVDSKPDKVVELPPPPTKPIKFDEAVVEKPKFDFEQVGTPPPGENAINPQTIDIGDTLKATPQIAKKIVLPMSNPRRPPTQPPYPAASQRLGEEGTVILELYVLENGRVGDATVYKSSGFPRLDQAAVEEAKRAWRLIPGTEDGRAIAMRYQFGVTFRLNN